MDENKLDAVRRYLNSKFPGSEIEEKNDFDLSAQVFKIHKDNDRLLLKVGEIFLDDHDEEKIISLLDKQKIAELLEENKTLGVLVTNNPPSIFNRD